jgi:O-antigen/teichoic acid export membrane protein
MTGPSAPETRPPESQRLIRGTLAIQGATLVSVVAFLAVATVLGRELGLSEFGVYGLTLSLTAYVAFVQSGVENAAIRALAQAVDADERDRAFTVTFYAYLVLGVGCGLLVAGGGSLLLNVFKIPDELVHQGQKGLLALGVVLAVGWVLRTFHDSLQGVQRFGATAVADSVGYIVFAVAVCTLALTGAPLWIVIAAGGTPMLCSGLACAVVVRRLHIGLHLRREVVDGEFMRQFASTSAYSFASSASDVVVYQLDRAVLGIFTSAATLGLYEAVVRPQLLLRQLHGTLSATVLPASAGYLAAEDHARTRALALRGTRYVLVIVVPLAVFVTVLAGPLLETWLGHRYLPGQWALAIFAGYWIFGANTGVLASMLFAHGGARVLAAIAWAIAGINLVLSLVLTPLIGLEGVVIGTTAAYAIVFPYFLQVSLGRLGVAFRDLLDDAWRPVYPLAAVLAVGLIAVRAAVSDPLLAVLAGAAILLCGYLALFLRVLTSDERATLIGAVSRT